jgi:hypothetical protein
MGNLSKQYYMDVIDVYRPDYRERILNGEYPAHLAKDGVYTIVWLKEEEITTYSIFNCTDEDFVKMKNGEFYGWPIVHDTDTDCGITPKLEDGRPNEIHPIQPDWSDWGKS